MITNVDKESQAMIEELLTAAMKTLDQRSIIGLAVFKQSIKLIEEPKIEEPKDEEVLQ